MNGRWPARPARRWPIRSCSSIFLQTKRGYFLWVLHGFSMVLHGFYMFLHVFTASVSIRKELIVRAWPNTSQLQYFHCLFQHPDPSRLAMDIYWLTKWCWTMLNMIDWLVHIIVNSLPAKACRWGRCKGSSLTTKWELQMMTFVVKVVVATCHPIRFHSCDSCLCVWGSVGSRIWPSWRSANVRTNACNSGGGIQ